MYHLVSNIFHIFALYLKLERLQSLYKDIIIIINNNNKMKIEKTVLKKISRTKKVKRVLSGALNKDVRTIETAIKRNEHEGILTTALSVKIISDLLAVEQSIILVEK